MSCQRSLYERVLGTDFSALDDAVARFHRLQGRYVIRGRCHIEGAKSPLLRWIARILRLPVSNADVLLQFDLDANPDREIWCRHFPQKRMRSTLFSDRGGLLSEQLGLARLQFNLQVENGWLSMHLKRVSIVGLRVPLRWMPEVWAHESGRDTTFRFDVGARWRGLGTLVAYRGELDLDSLEILE